ncbi:MAG: right-handed parallel beta-helix repeat-containing protein [Acidimicrobiia bacterium]
MRRLISIVSAVALGVGTLVAGGGPASAAGTLIVRPGESIQVAIDSAGVDGTVIVKKGVYRENLEITTDRLTLIGSGARLRSPSAPKLTVCDDPAKADSGSGICIHGQITRGPGGAAVGRPVRGVTVKGFAVEGFGGTGILVIGGADTEISSNRAVNNGEYGIFANSSTGTVVADNTTTSSNEAGIYIGDSPQSRAKVNGNETARNSFGVFIRSAQRGLVNDNLIHDNCVGVLALGDAPGTAGGFRMNGNLVTHNHKFCPADPDEGTPPLSGIGVAIVGGVNMTLQNNWIVDNVPSGRVPFNGGVVLVQGSATAPRNNTVRRNVILANQVDIFWDGSGIGNLFTQNHCETSDPAGLCT